jgi:SNF2 family DNA or RNA helicase
MGLGKTVQLIGFLSTLPSEKPKKASLLVIPASLIANWVSEIERFHPGLQCYMAHPDAQPRKNVTEKTPDALDRLDLVVTTYALVQKYAWLGAYGWRYVILDEAQAIKNPGTKQTKAVKALKARNRIVMTGTPIENRIGQKKNMLVHKFLTRGTIEEKIDQMLEAKSKLSEEVIAPSGEKWITEMDNEALMRLFQLTL